MKKKIIEIAVGDMKFTMPDVREQIGHDDSIPFGGTLRLNGKPVAKCFNDGWGGEACYYPINDEADTILDDIEKKLKNYEFVETTHDYRWELTLPFLVDELACCQLGQFELPDRIEKKAE